MTNRKALPKDSRSGRRKLARNETTKVWLDADRRFRELRWNSTLTGEPALRGTHHSTQTNNLIMVAWYPRLCPAITDLDSLQARFEPDLVHVNDKG
jgi:hypothetical protein